MLLLLYGLLLLDLRLPLSFLLTQHFLSRSLLPCSFLLRFPLSFFTSRLFLSLLFGFLLSLAFFFFLFFANFILYLKLLRLFIVIQIVNNII